MKYRILKLAGNKLQNYPIDCEVILNWNKSWIVWNTIYDKEKDKTFVYLQKL